METIADLTARRLVLIQSGLLGISLGAIWLLVTQVVQLSARVELLETRPPLVVKNAWGPDWAEPKD